MGTIAELQSKPDRDYPLLWLSNEGGSVEGNYKVDNIRLTMFGRVIVGEEGQDDDASEIEVLSDMQLILLDFLNYFHQQHGQEYVTDKAATLEHFTERTNDRTAGYSCVLELKQFYDWNKCQIPQSGAAIPPSVDGLTLYDFCDASVIDRLTATQLACLTTELCGVPSPVTEQINGTTIGTSASGSTNNQVIEDSLGNPVGTAANPSVIGDATIQNNATPTWTDTVEAEGTLTLAQLKVLDSDGVTPILADYIPNASGYAVTCTPSTPTPSLAVGLSNATPNYGDSVTITATPTGITPTSYTFYLPKQDGTYTIVTQASNVYVWTVGISSTFNLVVTATDGTLGATSTVSIAATFANGQAVVGNGVNQYIESALAVGDILTGNKWFMSVQFNATSFSNLPVLLSLGGSDFLEVEPTNIYIKIGGLLRTYTVSAMSTSTWYQIDIEKTGTGNSMNLYLNNVLQSSFTGSVSDFGRTGLLRILGYYSGAVYLNGKLDNVVFIPSYNPSSGQRTSYYNGGAGADPLALGKAPTVWLQFENGYTNSGSLAMSLTAYNTPTFAAH